MFKFGFDEPSSDGNTLQPSIPITSSPPPSHPPRKLSLPPPPALTSQPHDRVHVPHTDLHLLKSTACTPSHLSPSGADIIPSHYEGGFKLWECAMDLCHYLSSSSERPHLLGSAVLELGAGHAFPAIVAAKHGAEVIHVQDYNTEVVQMVTLPNLAANVDKWEGKAEFFAGSWRGLSKVLGRTYDVVLTADTVYATEQVEELVHCMVGVIAPRGCALVAGKKYYFGVGGGTRAFRKRLEEVGGEKGVQFEVTVVKEICDGVSNVREILKVTRPE